MKVDDLILIEHFPHCGLLKKYLASKNGSSTKYVAVKYIKDKKDKFKKFFYDNEIYTLNDTHHPNIIKLIDIKETSDDNDLVIEYCNGGNLEDLLKKYFEENKKPLTEEIVQYIMRQVINAVKYLHQKKIMHRNLKLTNILINYENEEDKKNNNIMKGKIKIADFALSAHLEKGNFESRSCGTPNYTAPEIFLKTQSERKYNEKIDIWSLGIICYQLLIGKFLFEAVSLRILKEKLNQGDYFVPITLSKEAISFLNCMLQNDPNKRYSCDQLSKHNFLTKDVNEFHKINLFELKDIEIIDYDKIKINIKNNDSIFEIFGDGIEDNIK